jgi:acyl dehydratase
MALDAKKLLAWTFADIERRYVAHDAILYALGVGVGGDPMDAEDLKFVYEDGLVALPTMAVVLGYPGFWLKDPATGVDWRQVLHGEQGLTLHAPLQPSGTVVGRSRITGLVDKGAGKGALLFSERLIIDKANGAVLATLSSTTVLRGDGGFGGANGPVPQPHALPERAPDASLDLVTSQRAALIYRLSGDDNPLHADPKVAAAAGFPKPILHGLCTYGVAGRALLRLAAGNDPRRLKSMQARFSAVVFPGETIRTEIWRNGPQVSFRCSVPARQVVVLNNGRAEVAA